MKKELKSGILSADKSVDHRPINRPTVGGVNVIAVLLLSPCQHVGVYSGIHFFLFLLESIDCGYSLEPPQ